MTGSFATLSSDKSCIFSHAADGFSPRRSTMTLFRSFHHPCIFVQSIRDVLLSFALIYIYFLSPVYFLTWLCLRKVVNGVVPNNVRAVPCSHPYDVRSLWWNAFINCVANLSYCTSMFYSQSFFIFPVLRFNTPTLFVTFSSTTTITFK